MNLLSESNAFLPQPGHPKTTKEVVIFLIIAFLFSWVICLIVLLSLPPDFKTGDVVAVEKLFGNMPMLFGTGPFIAAIIVTGIYHGRHGINTLLKSVVRWRVAPKWYLAALILPVISQWIGTLFWSLIYHHALTLPTPGDHLSSWLQITFISALYFVTEELGWRGFLLPRVLSHQKWIPSAFIVGLIWAIWHYPLWIFSYWATSGSWQHASVMVMSTTIICVGLSVMMTWLFARTHGSVLIAMILHGANNANMGKMYAASGEAAYQDSGFLLVQSCSLIMVTSLFLVILGSTKSITLVERFD
jgi:uncharacterized protein